MVDEFPLKMFSREASASSSGCFDCNICLDFAVDPVVTLCGHLYCWLCIYKWLQIEDRISPQSCPVCKAALSQDSLVPLYGHGTPAKRHHQAVAVVVPRRPPLRQHHHHRLHDHNQGGELSSSSFSLPMMSSAAAGLLGEMVVAVLPWVFRNHQVGVTMAGGLYYSSPYQQVGGSMRRQEMKVERWMNQIWVVLFFCALLCLLLF